MLVVAVQFTLCLLKALPPWISRCRFRSISSFIMRSPSLIGFCCAGFASFFEPANAFFFDAAAKTFLGFEELRDTDIGFGAVDDEVDGCGGITVVGVAVGTCDCSSGKAD